jgi:hypothetical protein
VRLDPLTLSLICWEDAESTMMGQLSQAFVLTEPQSWQPCTIPCHCCWGSATCCTGHHIFWMCDGLYCWTNDTKLRLHWAKVTMLQNISKPRTIWGSPSKGGRTGPEGMKGAMSVLGPNTFR